MTNTEIIYSALLKSNIEVPEIELEETEGYCMVCGKKIKEGAKYKKVLSGNFTDWDTLKNLDGTHICKECGAVIKTRELRTNNILADKEHLYLLKKNDLEEYLFNLDKYVNGQFIIGITRSFKKHNSFRCTVNDDTKVLDIREEDKEYIFPICLMRPLYDMLNEAYLYFTKDELLMGQYNLSSIQEFGLDKFNECENIFKQYRGSHQFDLLVYMMNSEVRNEIVNERIKKQKEEKDKQKRLAKEKKKREKNETEGQLKLF